MTTLLTLNANQDNASTIAAASKMVATQTGTTSSGVSTKIGTASGTNCWGQIYSKGNTGAWPALGAIGLPDGNGWLQDDTSLELQTIGAGLWQWIEKARITAGTATITLVERYYKYNPASGGTYTLIGSITLTANALTSSQATYTSASVSLSAMAFASGDKLYKDLWGNITANSGAGAGTTFALQTCNNAGLGLSGVAQVTTPGYNLTIPPPALSTAPSVMTFSAYQAGVSPASQNTTLSETVGTATAWTSAISYGSGSGWLAISPTSGSLSGLGSATIACTCTTGALTANTYTATVTFTATTGGATTTVTVTFVVSPPYPGYTVSIANNSVNIYETTYQLDDSVSQASTAMLRVRDDAGTNHYSKGQPVSITDGQHGLQFTGFLSTAIEDRESPNPLIKTDAGARDNHYLAEKRTYDGPEMSNIPAGAVVCQLLNVLAQEGITANYATRRVTTATDFGTGTLTNVVGASNVGDGDLELAPAGTQVVIVEDTTAQFSTGTLSNVTAANNTLMPTATNAVKLIATCTQPGSTNAYTYMKIWTGSHAVGANETFSYDIFVLASSPSGQMGVDVLFTDGTNWRDTALIPDAQFVFPHPNNDVGPMGVGQWYHRSFFWGQYSGKTIQSVQVVSEGDAVGVYTGYFKNIQLNASFFAFTSNTVQQIGNNGYGSSVVSLVPTYDLNGCQRLSPLAGYSIDAAKIVQSSSVTWTVQQPAGTLFQLKYSTDGGNIFQVCTKNAPLPNLPAGSTIAGSTIIWAEQFIYDPAVTGSARPGPEVAPVLSALQAIINPSYVATKTDVVYEVYSNSDWAGGTFTRTTNNGGTDLGLKQFIRNWDTGDTSNQTVFSTSAQTSADRQTFHISVPAAGGGLNAEARSRMDFAGTVADGTMECDVLIDNASVILSMIYRTTNWENHDQSWAYSVEITQTTMKLFKGPNSSSYGFTQIGPTATLNISSGNWHRLKVVFVGSSHQAYLDDVLYINQTDGTYTAAGQVALRVSNPVASAYVAHFDNFGVVKSGASLSGTWVSPAQSLTSVGTYATSVLSWRDVSSDPGNTDTLLVETQVDGSTWQTATNGAAIPNLTVGQSLSGISLSLRFTLTTTTASTSPLIDYIVARIVSQLSSSGTRVSPALSLANVGTLGGSVISWNNVALASGCTLGVDARVDVGSWTDITSSNGGPVPGLTAQGAVTLDMFAVDSHTSYTSTHGPSGVNASWTWDTSNNRLVASGGTSALLLYTGLSASDVDLQIILDQADYTGLVWREVDTSNYYFLVIGDASSSLSANIMQLFKVSGGVQAQIGTNHSGFSFPRGTVHAVRLTMIGGVITVSFDGTQVFTSTDGSPLGAGGVGLFNSTFSGGSAGRFYSFRVQPQGQNVSSHTVQTRMRLASTNPLATPQVPDLTIAVFGPNIGVGATMPQTAIFHRYISDAMADCVTASPSYWWNIDKNKMPYFLQQNALPSPWPASDGGTVPTLGDFQDANITVEDASDLYRNREIVDNVLAPVAINQTFFGDGASTTWTCANQWAAAPLVTITNVVTGVTSVATVGVLNVDTGKQFYWSLGSNTITEDATGPLYDFTFSLNFNGAGQYLTYSQADNVPAQTARALIEGTGTGINTWVVDGTGLTKAQGDLMAQSDVATYSNPGRLLKATTRRYGLQIGQALSVFLPAHGVWNQLFFVRAIRTHLTTEFPSGTAGGAIQQGWYEIEACSGADIGDWTRLYKRVGKRKVL